MPARQGLAATVLAVVSLLPAAAEATDASAAARRCQAEKILRAGVYDLCRLKLQARALRRGTTADLGRCDERFSKAWQRAEQNAGGECPTANDAATVRTQLHTHTDAVVAALSPAEEAPACGGKAAFPGCGGSCPDGTSCWAAAFPGPQTRCVCLPSTGTACGATGGFEFPHCGGTCPSGEVCATLDVSEALEFRCACIAEQATPCLSSDAPACGGACPAGSSCTADPAGLYPCACR